MRFKTLALFFWIFLIASAAIAGEEHRTRIEIVVDDDATRERITDALEAAGQDGEIQYIDGSEFDVDADNKAHGRREVRVIRNEVDVTN